MTQDELKLSKYNEVKTFIETNQRNLSRYRIEDHLLLNRLKQNRKLLNAGKLKEDRVAKFEKLLELAGVCDAIKKVIQIYTRKNGRRPRMVNAWFEDCRDVSWRVSTWWGVCDTPLRYYFPSLNFLYPSYLSFANCSVLANNYISLPYFSRVRPSWFATTTALKPQYVDSL